MSKIMQGVFGGSRSSQESGNKAFGDIKNAFSGGMQNFGTGAAALGNLLGGDSSGFDKYKEATGFDALMENGSRGITGNAAARGLLRSGSTDKALVDYSTMSQNKYAGDYMDRLMGQANLGLQAGGLVSGAGQYSKGKSSSKPGIGGFLGKLAGGIAASDRRLKKNIHKIGEEANGLGIYQYRYLDGSGPHIGYMADEVEVLAPEAMGPTIDGYKTVDYSKLEKVGA